MTTRQPEALRLADELCEAIAEYPEPTALEAQAAAELRRQHARIAELESQLAQRFDAADMATAAAQPVAEQANADSVQEDAARYRELREQHESKEQAMTDKPTPTDAERLAWASTGRTKRRH